MLKYSLIFILNLHLIAQTSCDSLIKSFGYEHHKVGNSSFIIYKNGIAPKPVVFFVRGSSIDPLFIDNAPWGAFPFNRPQLLDTNFHYAVVSKPYLPLCTDSLSNPYINSRLNKYDYFLEDGMPPKNYLLNNNIDSLNAIYRKIIHYTVQQKWCKNKQIHLFGHSAGARIAIAVAQKNPFIKSMVIAASTPFTRYHDRIREIRYYESVNAYTPEQAQEKVEEVYKDYQELFNNKTLNKPWGNSDTYLSWASHTFPPMQEQLVKLTIPVLYMYGSGDYYRLDNDYLKLYLIEKQKKNIQVKCYVEYDHNFTVHKYDETGKIETETKYHWREVCNDAIQWLKEH